jgi:hypothetical protein
MRHRSRGGDRGKLRTDGVIGTICTEGEPFRPDAAGLELEAGAHRHVSGEQPEQRRLLRFEPVEQLEHPGHDVGPVPGFGQLVPETVHVAVEDRPDARFVFRRLATGGQHFAHDLGSVSRRTGFAPPRSRYGECPPTSHQRTTASAETPRQGTVDIEQDEFLFHSWEACG